MENTTLSNAVDNKLLELHEIISNIKSKEDVGERSMTLQEMIDYEKRDSYEDGIKDGIMGSINICKSRFYSSNSSYIISRIPLIAFNCCTCIC